MIFGFLKSRKKKATEPSPPPATEPSPPPATEPSPPPATEPSPPPATEPSPPPATEPSPPPVTEPTAPVTEKDLGNTHNISSINKSFFGKLRQIVGMADDSLDDLAKTIEEELLMADFGVAMTNKIINKWREDASFIEKGDGKKHLAILAQMLEDTLTQVSDKLIIPEENRPFCVLVMGVNGSGKTTTLAKLAYYYKHQGLRPHIAAGDTYRAAAVEQLEHWATKLEIPITKGDAKLESAAVIYKGMQEALSNQADIYLMDTSGRMPNNNELKEQLRKCIQVVDKLNQSTHYEILLVLDASHGQSALMQAKLFCEAVPVSGIAITKLDGAAKGGVIFALAEELKLPIRFIGVGEKESDLLEFDAKDYVRELLPL